MDNLKWIDDCIVGLIELYNTQDIYELYKCLDIKIVKLQKDNILLQNSEAFYYRDFFDEEVVFIRDDLDYKYEKFVLAHELGHALLHTEICATAFNKSLINKGKLERQANYFALKLLNIEIDPVEFRNYTIEDISKSLYVSEEALSYLY